MKSLSRVIFLGVMSAALSGCATYNMMKPPPAQTQPVTVVYTPEGPSGWNDLPIGVYRVPNTNVIISGHQEGGNIGMLFGLVGVLAQDAVNTGIGKGKVSGVQEALQIDLTPQAQAITSGLLASAPLAPAFAATPDPAGPTLEVTPYAVLTFANDTDVQPWVILKATLHSAGSTTGGWSTRYIATVGRPVVFVGDNSLTANGGALLKSTLSDELSRAIKAMLTDVATHPARDGASQVYVESGLPFIRARMGLVGPQLSNDGSTLVYVPKIADAVVFAGVHVLDVKVVGHRPATKDDEAKIVDTGN